MNLPYTAGFEYEFSGSTFDVNSRLKTFGVPHLSSDVGRWRRSTGGTWDIKTDSSCGAEVSTPVIATYEELVDAAHVASLIHGAGGRVTENCGFHVHIGVASLNNTQLENVFRFMTRYEDAIRLLVPESRRNKHWCKKLPAESLRAFKNGVRKTDSMWWTTVWCDKNVWLNGRRFPEIGTLEFRLMPGTLDPNFVIGYVIFLQCVIEAVKDRKISWGVAKSADQKSLFQTMLGQAGFYGPFRDAEHKELCVSGRKWAQERFELAQQQAGYSPEFCISKIPLKIPTVSLESKWTDPSSRTTAKKPARVRRPRQPLPACHH